MSGWWRGSGGEAVNRLCKTAADSCGIQCTGFCWRVPLLLTYSALRALNYGSVLCVPCMIAVRIRRGVWGRGWAQKCVYRFMSKDLGSLFSDGPIKNSVVLVRERTVPSDRRLSVKLVPIFGDRRCRVVSATDPQGRILGFLDRSDDPITVVEKLFCSRTPRCNFSSVLYPPKLLTYNSSYAQSITYI
jgi:hypothetical protein